MTILGSAFSLCATAAGRSAAVRAATFALLALAGVLVAVCGFVCARRFALPAGGAAQREPAAVAPGGRSVSETARDLMADFRSTSRAHPVSGEARCRELLERWFGRPFPKVRPDWLVNPETGHRLELDCFNEELRLAVEYDGIQHSVFVPHFHASEAAFAAQQERDRVKERVCAERGVALVRVPYTHHTAERLEPFLREALAPFLQRHAARA